MWTLEYRGYRLPFRLPVRTAHGSWTEREGVLVRVSRHREGVVQCGWGEVAPIPWFGTETAADAEAALAGLEGRAEGLADALARVGPGRPATAAALAAAWAEAEAADAVEAAWPGFLPVAGLLPAGRGALDEAARKAELGFRVFKWKVGVLPAMDERVLLDELLARLPAGSRVRLDANGAWDRRTAEAWLDCAAERPIEYVEQPVAPDARGVEDVLIGLAADYPVKLALDESVNSGRDVERWLGLGWNGVWVLKPSLMGEPAETLARLRRASADVVFGSALETRVGARAGLRLAFAWASALNVDRRRALGYGVWPLFAKSVADGGAAAPFVRRDELARANVAELWDSLC